MADRVARKRLEKQLDKKEKPERVVVQQSKSIHDEVSDMFTECEDSVNHAVGQCRCARANPLHSTASESSSATRGRDASLVRNALGARKGLQVLTAPQRKIKDELLPEPVV